MTIPRDVKTCHLQVETWLLALKERAMLATHNQSFAQLRGVLHELRDRMTVERVAAFGNSLPAIFRGVFYQDWMPGPPAAPEPDIAAFKAAVVARLTPHQIGPDSLVEDVFFVIKTHVDPHEAAQLGAQLPQSLVPLWEAIEGVDFGRPE